MRANTLVLAAAIVGAAHATAAGAEAPRRQSLHGNTLTKEELTEAMTLGGRDPASQAGLSPEFAHRPWEWTLVDAAFTKKQLRDMYKAVPSSTTNGDLDYVYEKVTELLKSGLTRDEILAQSAEANNKVRLVMRDEVAGVDNKKDYPKAPPQEHPHLPLEIHHARPLGKALEQPQEQPQEDPEEQSQEDPQGHHGCPICGCEQLSCCKCPETKTTCPEKTTTRCTEELNMIVTPPPPKPTGCRHNHTTHSRPPPVTVPIGGAAQVAASGLGVGAAALVGYLLL